MLTCNYLGNRAWSLALEWDGKKSFNDAEEHSWKDQGLARTAQGLTFLQVYDAGHMVPADQPKVALDMIGNFMNGGAF
jgi:cathepsin A (carboxypeptidase C)